MHSKHRNHPATNHSSNCNNYSHLAPMKPFDAVMLFTDRQMELLYSLESNSYQMLLEDKEIQQVQQNQWDLTFAPQALLSTPVAQEGINALWFRFRASFKSNQENCQNDDRPMFCSQHQTIHTTAPPIFIQIWSFLIPINQAAATKIPKASEQNQQETS